MMAFGPLLPGQTPIDDLSGLKIKGITTQKELNEHEAENVRKAVMKYLSAKPTRHSAKFDVSWALKLHREMFGDVWTWAGALRQREVNLGSAPVHLSEALHNLFEDLKEWQRTGMSLTEQAVRLHHGAVKIHPFQNGNGRWSRLLANIWLRLNDARPIEWPEATIGAASTVRQEYIDAVKAADGFDFAPLTRLHERFSGTAN